MANDKGQGPPTWGVVSEGDLNCSRTGPMSGGFLLDPCVSAHFGRMLIRVDCSLLWEF